MKRMLKMVGGIRGLVEALVVLVVLFAMTEQVLFAGPIELDKATVQEAAQYQATHVLDISFDDPSFKVLTTSNALWATTNAVPANSYARMTLMKLMVPWEGANTESYQIYSGTAGDTNVFLEATQIAADGTEVYFKTSPFEWSEGNYISGGTNVVTNIITTAYGYQYFTTATNIITKIQSNSLCAPVSNTAGRVRLYFQLYTP